MAEDKLEEMIEGHEHEYSDEDYKEALKLLLPVFVGKVDCVDHSDLCREQGIMGYPTIRLFHEGRHAQDYHGHRTVVEMTHWLASLEEILHKHKPEEDRKEDIASADDAARFRMGVEESRDDMKTLPVRPKSTPGGDSPEEVEWAQKMKRHQHRQHATWNEDDHPGCQLSGYLMVDRAPGHFHIQARSKNHDIAAHMTNVSHEIHHLSFGDLPSPRAIQIAEEKMAESKLVYPPGLLADTHPMDGNVYITHNVHEAHHHYLKVVTNNFLGSTQQAVRRIVSSGRIYTILQSSQLSFFRNDIVPEAKITYDLSPISVSYHSKSRHWYDYVTSLMAIVGGTFTIVGIIDSAFSVLSVGRRRRK